MLVGPNVKNIFVFSDDGAWVEEQILLVQIFYTSRGLFPYIKIKVKKTHPQYNIYTLSQPKSPKENIGNGKSDGGQYWYMRSGGGTESG